MNKLRLIKIYELRGLIHPLEAAIIELLDGIEKEPHRDWTVYKKDGMDYFSYYKNINNLWLYSPLCYTLNCTYEDLIVIMKYLLKKHLKLEIRYYNE